MCTDLLDDKKQIYMKKIFLILSLFIGLVSCQDKDLEINPTDVKVAQTQEAAEGMQRIVVNSRSEIKALINRMGNKTKFDARSADDSGTQLSNNEDEFISLIEANKAKVYESLSPEELSSVLNDPDSLEYCPSDSIIADIQFAMLLNANREIQVADTVYRYIENGVIYTKEDYANELDSIVDIAKEIEVTPDNEGTIIAINENTSFIPVCYAGEIVDAGDKGRVDKDTLDLPAGPVGPPAATSDGDYITLYNGRRIPQTDIRDVDYSGGGDGNWFHKFLTGIFGRNVVALKRFDGGKRQVNLNFYDQNYVIYSNIGSKLKFQKKKFGIWWNCKADEMVQGWNMISMKYSMQSPIYNRFTNPFTGEQDYPSHIWDPFPKGKDKVLLLTIPVVNYDFTTENLNSAFNSALKFAFNKAAERVKNLINKDMKRAGLMMFDNQEIYIVNGPYSYSVTNKKSTEYKFYSRWFPGTYEFGFGFNGDTKFVKIHIDGNDHVELHQGIVYGAIKYKEHWYAARITKKG